jgi:hypothetical protein
MNLITIKARGWTHKVFVVAITGMFRPKKEKAGAVHNGWMT